MPTSSYPCSQQELYVGCRIGWNLCSMYLPDFSELKAKYTPEFIQSKLDAINAADALFDADARYAEVENMRKDLVENKDKVLILYGKLLAYIDDAFQKGKWDTEYKAAGQGYYEEAAKGKWTSVTALLSSAIPYIEKNKVNLMDADNMPDSFQATFQTAKTAFDNLYQAYLAIIKQAATLTSEKIEANNAIFESFRAMFSDAKRIFHKQQTIADKFTMTAIFTQTRGVKQSDMVGTVNTGKKTKGIAKAKITLNNNFMVTTTDKDGYFEFLAIPPDVYKIVIEADGYETVTLNKEKVKTGTSRRLTIEMKVVTEAVMA